MQEMYRKVVCVKLTSDFEAATKIVECKTSQLEQSMTDDDVLVNVSHVGINASDVNFTAGRYDAGKKKLPFDTGFEVIGFVSKLGAKVPSKVQVGSGVMFIQYGAFSEIVKVDHRLLVPVPSGADPKYLAGLVAGLTAYIPLKYQVSLSPGQVVLITAAAGGVGHMAVQYAVSCGCKVIGTCSSTEKMDFLKSLQCSRVINYKTEDIDSVLKSEYPQGVDVVIESVGGKTFDACFSNLAIRGKLIVIGSISHYKEDQDEDVKNGFNWGDKVATSALIKKSASVTSFFLNHFPSEIKETLPELIKDIATGKLRAHVEVAGSGVEGIKNAVNYLQSGKNMGKVVASIQKALL